MKISKEKRNQLILVILVTVGVLAGLWFGLIRAQQLKLQQLSDRKQAADRKLKLVREMIESAGQIEASLQESSAKLAKLEEGMASGDVYAWAINAIRQFKVGYRVDIPQFSTIDGPKDVNLIPNFPYKQATMTIGGTAAFHDFGTFLADFENKFPYCRVLNLNLEPASTATGADREKLSFRMDIVALVKPGSA